MQQLLVFDVIRELICEISGVPVDSAPAATASACSSVLTLNSDATRPSARLPERGGGY
jgi:hypothetical protein